MKTTRYELEILQDQQAGAKRDGRECLNIWLSYVYFPLLVCSSIKTFIIVGM